ncbi:thioesterase family protein [Blastococcus sp. TF02A-26]|uniref:thioesterase family protein n=1 Tax=Blastococcus sp. TF02A-26 TaxID=2250577 RepID=UPI000DEB757F|nr:thioesterase family protein [Blastococcus sp. TF02A-26]RBY80785.1 thioesterase family protein [Blastococcus sp. TF02A-26]
MTGIVVGSRILAFEPSWRSFSSIQGGLLVGHLLDAATGLAGAPPRTVAAHLLGPVRPEAAVTLGASVDRPGRTASVRATLTQDGVLRATAQVLTVAVPATPVSVHGSPRPGDRPGDGEPFALPRDLVPIADQIEIRALGAHRPLAGGDEPRLTAWVRIHGDLPPLVRLGVLFDALPPSLFAVRTTPLPMPTAELTAHVAGAAPGPEAWVRIDQWTVWHDADVAVDDAELRTEDGALLARVRQTRRIPRPASRTPPPNGEVRLP